VCDAADAGGEAFVLPMIVGSVSQLSDVEASAHGKSVRWANFSRQPVCTCVCVWGGGEGEHAYLHPCPVIHKEEERGWVGGGGAG
jgi:hypothetical protein